MEVDKQPSQGAGAAAPDTALFSAAVTAAIHGWDPLVTAVQQGWGGDESEDIAMWLPSAVLERFGAAERVYEDELEDFLVDVMSAEFNSEVEAAVCKHVVKQIIAFKLDCDKGGSDDLRAYVAKRSGRGLAKHLAEKADAILEGAGGTAGDREPTLDEEIMDMGLDDDGGGGGGGGGPVLDADGWEVVAPKGGRKGRK